MRALLPFLVVAGATLVLVTCGVGGSGQPVPPLPSDFAPGSAVPGWVLTLPGEGRADVQAAGTHAQGRWTVLLRRPLRPVPRDVNFSVAVTDDGKAHAGVANVRFTADPNAFPDAETVVSRRVPNGQIVPDGAVSPGEWPAFNTTSLPATPQNDFPAGAVPATAPFFLQSESAYDDDHVYFLFRWSDPTRSDLGPQLQWNGAGWSRRPHRANDVNGNGLLDPGEPAAFTAPAEDEDRLLLFWPLHDASAAWREGGPGCAASCHANLTLDPTGAEALHAWTAADDRTDVWHWRASATAPGRRADDGLLLAGNPAAGLSGGGSGFAGDAGAAPFQVQDPVNPATMFAAPVAAQLPLVGAPLTFAAGTLPGYPALPTVAANAAPLSLSNFNATGGPPAAWTGAPPFFGNNYLPPSVQTPPDGSRADLETGSSHSGTQWIVEVRRRRVTRDTAGAPRPDDVHFEEDADFLREAYAVTSAANGLPFSVSITDDASGHGVREALYPGPLFLSRDESLAGPVLVSDLLLHDYGAGFSPASAADFTDPRETRPAPSGGNGRALVLKAGTDGGQNLFVLALWDDPAPDAARDRWTWNGFTWVRSGSEDELRVLWSLTTLRAPFAQSGCAAFCHAGGGVLGAPAGPHFSTSALGETADLWHWRAGRTAPSGAADDGTLDWRFQDLVPGAPGGAAAHADRGRTAFTANSAAGRAFPVFMAATDPNANAPLLGLGVPGLASAVPFRDVLGNLPPPPPSGGTGVSFSGSVLPIFQTVCSVCHPPLGGLDLQSYGAVLAGGMSGPVVIPGNSAGSILIRRLTGQLQPQMPLGGPYLSAAEIQTIADWIDQGAPNN